MNYKGTKYLVPAWAEWIAVDVKGRVSCFSYKPLLEYNMWVNYMGRSKVVAFDRLDVYYATSLVYIGDQSNGRNSGYNHTL